jgi:hypothetical protein
MIAKDFKSTQYVINTKTGDVGMVYAIVASPIGLEDLDGIYRVQVWTTIPGSDGLYKGWDWWLLEDCTPAKVNQSIPQGAPMTVVCRDGYERSAVALAKLRSRGAG